MPSLNLSDPLAQPEPNKIRDSSKSSTGLVKGTLTHSSGADCCQSSQKSAGQPTSSLAQLMAHHEQKTGQNISFPATLNTGSSSSSLFSSLGPSPLQLSLNTSGLNLGLSTSPGVGSLSISPAPSLLSCSLGSLSLQDPKVAMPLSGVSLGSLSNVLQSSKPIEVMKPGGSGGPGGLGQGTGSPSLAELIQAHQSSSPELFSSVPGPQNLSQNTILGSVQSINDANTAKTHQNSLNLSCLASQSAPKPLFPAATSVPPGFSAAPSLADLISQHQTPKIAQHQPFSVPQKGINENKKGKASPDGPQNVPQNVDLSVLMSQTSPGISPIRHDSHSPSHHHFLSRDVPKVFAEPSVFALTLCVRMKKKNRSQRSSLMHKAFLYSRQMTRVKERVQGPPLHHITPFSFDTPSPDDIVKANQKKAFTRD